MTVPGVAQHVPGTQPHTSGDLGGEGEGGERPTTHTSAHTARGARAVALLWPGPRPSTRSHADRLSSTQQLAWWRGGGDGGLRRSAAPSVPHFPVCLPERNQIGSRSVIRSGMHTTKSGITTFGAVGLK